MKATLLRVTGILLLGTAATVAFLWFYWLAPARHTASSDWQKSHTAYARWGELQKTIQRGVLISHESGLDLGQWGDKSWVEWLIARMKTGEDIDSCCQGHLVAALPFITNHELGSDTNAWISWWEANKDHERVEWVRDGFRTRGLNLEEPLTTNNIFLLLKLMGSNSQITNALAITNNHVASLRYNAFRWLQRSSIRPTEVNLDLVSPEEKPSVISGLLRYALWLGDGDLSVGKLKKEKPESNPTQNNIWMEKDSFGWFLALLLFAIGATGVFLFRRANGQRSKSLPS